MKYFNINNPIDFELTEKFTTFYNQFSGEDCTAVLNTRGGDNYYAEILVHMMNQMPNLTMIIQAAYSSGLYLAMATSCKKILSRHAKGMWHYGRVEMTLSTNKKPYYNEDQCHFKNLQDNYLSDDLIAQLIMTEDEYRLFKKHEEIYFTLSRMQQIFSNAEILPLFTKF